jgi:hypothetical protein
MSLSPERCAGRLALAVALALALAPRARAQFPCSGVKFIRLNNSVRGDYMNINEVQVWTHAGVNVARGQVTRARGVYSSSYPTSRAVDGNFGQVAGESFYHSNLGVGEFWEVELFEPATISHVTIYGRWNNTCCRER